VSIDIEGFAFTPASATAAVGQEVRWRNRDGATHTVTFSGVAVDSGALGKGAEFSHVFTTPGTYTYICAIHPTMKGTLEVR
jgi:plastocyanin